MFKRTSWHDIYTNLCRKQILHFLTLSAMTSCDITFCTIWHLTRSQYGCYRLKHAICKDLNLKFLGFMTKSDQNKGLYQVFYIYNRFACLYLSRLGSYLVPVPGCQFWTGSTDRGIVNRLFRPLRMVQLSCCFAYRSPRHPITKFRWFCGSKLWQFWSKASRSQSYEWAKICVFDTLQPSVVDCCDENCSNCSKTDPDCDPSEVVLVWSEIVNCSKCSKA